MKQSKREAGITLMEIIVTLAIISILTVIGKPSFSNQASSADLRSAAEEVLMAYRVARMESVRRTDDVLVNVNYTDGDISSIDVTTTESGSPVTLRRVPLDKDIIGVKIAAENGLSLTDVGQINYSSMGYLGNINQVDDSTQITTYNSILAFICSRNLTGETGRSLRLHKSGMVEIAEFDACP